ncbi:hypothetical protein THMIRHAM_01160 [Thiomicrorhabdus immobilis]|uniref:Uroporphyrinogen-III synthase n=1 Tax=Thiomicrorhabdus immobilis TaxID=2791037 RepID=A0ABM7MAG3_9GAMM|nr:uroporphyrinogen-III synthase [Thiomicrorhabdus immobilis]BCN92331.1 hypothetical protein THMIRHAM_01160 [Thiomicrorhabdus immobilis]
MNSLFGLTLLNTRPAHQAKVLTDLVESQGGQVIACPLMDIEWMALSEGKLANCQSFDKVIFTSSNAVEGWRRFQEKIRPADKALFAHSDYYAIGKATQAKGQEAGLKIRSLSLKQFDSEHFLAHEEMLAVAGESIALMKGVEGRTLIEDTLLQRGAKVTSFEVYQRQAVTFCDVAWQRFLNAKQPVLLISSLDSWHKLLAAIMRYSGSEYTDLDQSDKNQNECKQKEIMQAEFWSKITSAVVMSQRIASAMQNEGFKRPIAVVETQSNEGIVKALQSVLN